MSGAPDRLFCESGRDDWGSWGYCYRDRIGENTEYIRADLAPKIKPLIWDHMRHYADGYGLGFRYHIHGCEGNEWKASCDWGRYSRWASDEIFGSPEAAKAACFAHFEQQVREALE